ncbi:MAG: PH domain-containing protein [Microthrixaceae bacterium]
MIRRDGDGRRWVVRPGDLARQAIPVEEEILYDCAPNMTSWVWEQWLQLIVMGALVTMVALAHTKPVTVVGGAGLVLLIGDLVARGLRKLYTRYVVTEHRVVRISGPVRLDFEWIGFNKVTEVSVTQSVFNRILGTASVTVHSARDESAFRTMSEVPSPVEFTSLIVTRIGPPD